MPQMSQVLRERAIGTLTAGMSTRAVSPWIECSFLHHKPSPKAFQRIWQYIQTAPQTQATCNHTSPGPPHPASSPPRSSETDTRTAAATIGLHNQRNSAQTARNRLREAHLHARHPHRGLDLTAVRRRNRLEWANAHIRWRLALWWGVLFTDESRFSLYWANGRQRVWRRVGEQFADVNVVDRVAHGGSVVMVWAGVCYGQQTQVRCILLMAFWIHRDTVTRFWDPLLCHLSTTITSCCSMIMHSPMLQRSVHNSWKLKTSQFLHGQHTHLTRHVTHWACLGSSALDRRIRQRVPVPANIQQLRTAIEEEWTNISQSTTWSTLCKGDVLHCTRYWLVFGPPLTLTKQ